jgi:hypothetical protein
MYLLKLHNLICKNVQPSLKSQEKAYKSGTKFVLIQTFLKDN